MYFSRFGNECKYMDVRVLGANESRAVNDSKRGLVTYQQVTL
jgi:hypothetical protein